MRFFATVTQNLEHVLKEELESLGITELQPTGSGVWFEGGLEQAYRVCLWSRVATSVLLHLETFEAKNPEQLYEGAKQIAWREHLDVQDTFSVQVSASRATISHTRYALLKVKDAIVDQFRERLRARPSIDVEDPDVYIHLHRDEATLSIDLSGKSLHRRGWRTGHVQAPLKETLAAAILYRGGWPQMMHEPDVALLDPMCGSGTFLIEGWMMAADIAPGLGRPDGFGLETWLGHDRHLWNDLLKEARERQADGLEKKLPTFVAYDKDHHVVKMARQNVHAADAAQHIRIQQREILEVQPPADRGLLVTNPPYGERLDELEQARDVHERLGSVMANSFLGWDACIITGSKELGFLIPIRATKRYSVYNGPLQCTLLTFEITPERLYAPES